MDRIRRRARATALALILMLAAMGSLASTASAQTNPLEFPINVTGTFADNTTGTFVGTFELLRFQRQGRNILAIGTLTGTVTDSLGNVVGTLTDFPVAIPVDLQQVNATCEILELVIGPIDLDLLGLVVELGGGLDADAPIVLRITAEQGPGNLLGNLLCAIAGLLDGPGSAASLQAIVNLLNQILGALG